MNYQETKLVGEPVMGVERRKWGRKAPYGIEKGLADMTGGRRRPLSRCSLSSHCRALVGQLSPASRTMDENKPTYIEAPKLLSFTTRIYGETCRSSNMLMTSSKTGSVELKWLGRY